MAGCRRRSGTGYTDRPKDMSITLAVLKLTVLTMILQLSQLFHIPTYLASGVNIEGWEGQACGVVCIKVLMVAEVQ